MGTSSSWLIPTTFNNSSLGAVKTSIENEKLVLKLNKKLLCGKDMEDVTGPFHGLNT